MAQLCRKGKGKKPEVNPRINGKTNFYGAIVQKGQG